MTSSEGKGWFFTGVVFLGACASAPDSGSGSPEGTEATAATDATDSATTEPCDPVVSAVEICACDDFTLDLSPILDRARADGLVLTDAFAIVYPDGPAAYGKRQCAGGYRQADTVGGAWWTSEGPTTWSIPTTAWAGMTMLVSVTSESEFYLAGPFAPTEGSAVNAVAAE